MIGSLYDRYKARDLIYYRFATYYAIYEKFFFLFMLANIGFPPSQFHSRIFYFLGVGNNDLILSLVCVVALFNFSGIINFGFTLKFL